MLFIFDSAFTKHKLLPFISLRIHYLDMMLNMSFIHFIYCLQFNVYLGPESPLDKKVDHRRHIVLWYWQHATNLAMVTVFIVCMSLVRVLVGVRGRAKQKRALTFYVFGQTRSKCSSSSTFPKSQSQKSLSVYGTPFDAPNITSSCELPHWNRARAFRSWMQLMSHK